MLESLHIENYALIDSLDIEFPEGLVIISGQTGAGKSILLGALSLALGDKADPAVISQGASCCVVEASFSLKDANPELLGVLEENDIDTSEGCLLIRRTIALTGRSRSFVNDEPVNARTLNLLRDFLVDIHSQHQTLLLKDKTFQLGLLDAFAQDSQSLAAVRENFASLSSVRAELAKSRKALAEASAHLDYNKAQLDCLEAASLKDTGELEELERSHKTLSNVEFIRQMLSEISSLDSLPDGLSLCGSLKEIHKRLDKLSSCLDSASEIASRIESSRIELEDIFSEISSLESKCDFSPSELERVEQRMSLLYSLLKKYSCNDIASLIEKREEYRSMLSSDEMLSESIETLEKELHNAEDSYNRSAAALSSIRRKACRGLSDEITSSLHFLELPLARFECVLEPLESPGADGAETVAFLFNALGQTPTDVSKCASGGELSRIMLCLKDLKAKYEYMPTMIFDEIDSGVSGSVADRMGEMICRMGGRMQVLAITHLPQVASKGKVHFLVSKDASDPASKTSISLLDFDGRVQEIARMLSGATLTKEALANARALLG